MSGPASQKAATMSVEPSPSTIQELVTFTDLPYDLARRYLKVKHNDVQAAANAFYDNEDIDKLEKSETWDESAFNADREGNQQLAPLGQSAAPTRGPSPAPSLGLTNPKTQADEDEELNRALLMSKGQDVGQMSFQQETGVRKADGTESKYFGPATKDHYEEQQWGMTIAREVVPDLPARERTHAKFEPRILKHLPDGDYTPNLISICHAIPRAKEALLLRLRAKTDYRYDADWWKGHPIALPRIVHTTDGSPADPDADKHDEFITEVQRLLAVLDASDRNYVTIGALTQVEMIRDADLSSKSGSLLELFLQSWIEAVTKMFNDPDRNDQISAVFNTVVGTNADEGMRTPHLTVVDMSAKTTEGQKVDLSELLDNLLWDTSDESNMADNYIERPADIIVMRMSQANASATQLGVEVPAALSLDKYMRDNVAASRATRQRMAQGKKRVAKIEEIEKKLNHWQHPTKSTQVDAQQLLKHTLGHFSGQNRRDVDKADTTNNASLEDYEHPGYAEIAAKLEAVIASVEEKLKMLAEEKEKTRKAISEMSKAPIPGVDEAKHRYTLRGVATKPNITYILQPKDPDDSSPLPQEETTPAGYEWWRVEYEVSGSEAKITTTRTGDYDVLRAVELEHNTALLVYASDDHEMEPSDESLPQGLQTFVDQDNSQLEKEMRDAMLEEAPPAYDFNNELSTVPRVSIERRDSMDSMANMADSPTRADYLDDPTQHHAFGLGYDVKTEQNDEVHEIHLDEQQDGGRNVEMVEKANAHSPLVSQTKDVAMGGVESQDLGVGGAEHVEDREME